MPIFFIATGPALALLAQRSEWRAHRKQASLKVQVSSRAYSRTHRPSRDHGKPEEKEPR
jgi:hypothetical protein